jgi:hypothetical protein
MRKPELSMETKQAILEDYNNPNIKAHDVHNKYGISQQVMQRIVLELGGELRRPKSACSSKSGNKVCPNCHKKIEIKGARYCPFCATDIRSEKDILREKIDNMLALYTFLPEGTRDNFISTLNEVKNILSREGK